MKKRFKKVLTVVLAMAMLIGLFTVNVPVSAASNCIKCDYSGVCKCTYHPDCGASGYWATDKDRIRCECEYGVSCSNNSYSYSYRSGPYGISSSQYLYLQVTNLQEFEFYASFYGQSSYNPVTEEILIYMSGHSYQTFHDYYDDNTIRKHIKLDTPYTGTVMISLRSPGNVEVVMSTNGNNNIVRV